MWVDGKLSSSVVPDNILLSRDVERSKNGVGWGERASSNVGGRGEQ